jgi:hypothetical protein
VWHPHTPAHRAAALCLRRLRAIRRLIQTLPKQQVILWVDGVGIHLSTSIGPDWMLRGTHSTSKAESRKRKSESRLASSTPAFSFPLSALRALAARPYRRPGDAADQAQDDPLHRAPPLLIPNRDTILSAPPW